MFGNEIIDFSLSLENFKNIPFSKYEKNFTFVLNGKRYPTNRLIADILSPYIRNYHFINSSIDEFYLNSNASSEEQENEDFFNDFLNMASFQNSKLDFSHQLLFAQYFYLLGNFDEYFRVQPKYCNNYTSENVVDILLSMSQMSSIIPAQFNIKISPMNELISFVAQHFEEIEKEKMKKLSVDIIDEILQNKYLKLSDEDSLLQFILYLYENNHSYSVLFEYVQFSNVSNDSLQLFIKLFEVNDINQPIWNSICCRLIQDIKQINVKFINSKNVPNSSNQNTKSYQTNNFHQNNAENIINQREFQPLKVNDDEKLIQKNLKEHESQNLIQDFKFLGYQEGKEFDGIMNYLTKETGGNIHDNGTIEITSNSINSDNISNHPKNLVDYQEDNLYCSKDAGEAIICFDFKDKMIQLTNYSIKSYNCGKNWSHLKNWVIEVSNNGNTWEEIDRHDDDKALNGENIIATFNITKPDGFYRFVRLRQTGPSWSKHSTNHNLIVFPFIEFYGKLKIL